MRRLHMHLIGVPDRDDGEHMGEAIRRYNFWEFSRIVDRHESSEWKLQVTTQRKINCKKHKKKYYKRTTGLIDSYLITTDVRRKWSNSF